VLAAHDDCDGVLAVFANGGRWDASNVALTRTVDGGEWAVYEKGSRDPAFDHIDYGATALRREVIAALPAAGATGGPHGLDQVQHDLGRRQRLRACVARERFFEIGSPDGLADLDRYLRTKASS
jgi:hypothetical protein